ncbi:MAG TPA: hypothetical protein VH253_04090 [Phycisphaerae bacterium]|nr:hypothetical protein [Phycisphaerae bacterium]
MREMLARTTAAGLMLAAIGAAGLGGCNQTPARARDAILFYHEGNFPQAAAVIQPAAAKKDENYVLDNCRYGSCTLAAGQLANAENAFMNAYQVMNSTHVNDSGRTLGATVVFEGVKVWTGEPFERAMAHYYLGLVFLIQHDYENARAAFQNSLFDLNAYADKDNLQSVQKKQSDFALGYFGLGFCYLRLNRPDLAQQNFDLAVKVNPAMANVVAQARQPGVNTLIFVDSGWGPVRAPKGWYNEESAFGPTPAEAGPVPPVIAYVDGRAITTPAQNGAFAMVDTLAMAQEQRWQDIDTIRKTKAVIGTGLMAGGAGVAAYGAEKKNKAAMWGGLGAVAAGALLAASSQADVRYWEMLPRTVYVVPLTLPPGPHDVMVYAGGDRSAPIHVTVPPVTGGAAPGTAHQDTVVYFRLLGGNGWTLRQTNPRFGR